MSNEYFEKYGFPQPMDDIREYWEDWKMTDKRSYKEILSSVETHFIYINNHLNNIDKHLERQNNSITEHGKSITKNSTWISAIKYMVYMLIVAFIGAITTNRIGLW